MFTLSSNRILPQYGMPELQRCRLSIRGPERSSRRVSTTLRQVLRKFSEFFVCRIRVPTFPQGNFASGSPSNDDRQLGRPPASPFFPKVDRCCFICLLPQAAVPEWKSVC